MHPNIFPTYFLGFQISIPETTERIWNISRNRCNITEIQMWFHKTKSYGINLVYKENKIEKVIYLIRTIQISNFHNILVLRIQGESNSISCQFFKDCRTNETIKCLNTPPNSEIICGRNVSTKVVCGIILFFEKKAMLKIWKKSWEPFRSYLLNSTANPAHLQSNWPHIISELGGV